MLLHEGENYVDGLRVVVVRRRAKRIILRVTENGDIQVTLPKYGATLKSATEFFIANRGWVEETRTRVLERPKPMAIAPLDVLSLQALLDSLMKEWTLRLGEPNVTWKLRAMKTRWGVCNYLRRQITYAVSLAAKDKDEVEYVVVHELTHLKAHGHGDDFKALMDSRLPNWRDRKRRLNGR